MAFHLAQKNFVKGGNNRVILATDGDFNVGASSDEAMENLIVEKRKSGVFLSVLGFGYGNYKDSKLEILVIRDSFFVRMLFMVSNTFLRASGVWA